MDDFISRSALIEDLKWLKSVVNESSKNEVQDFIDRVENFPKADAVEVIRCKGCRWFNTKKLRDRGICDHPTTGILIPEENDFCSYGIKKDGDGNGT